MSNKQCPKHENANLKIAIMSSGLFIDAIIGTVLKKRNIPPRNRARISNFFHTSVLPLEKEKLPSTRREKVFDLFRGGKFLLYVTHLIDAVLLTLSYWPLYSVKYHQTNHFSVHGDFWTTLIFIIVNKIDLDFHHKLGFFLKIRSF